MSSSDYYSTQGMSKANANILADTGETVLKQRTQFFVIGGDFNMHPAVIDATAFNEITNAHIFC